VFERMSRSIETRINGLLYSIQGNIQSSSDEVEDVTSSMPMLVSC